ncbi:MAG: T9SS type A sorting domain-containing protein [Crocinitomicaceae bacterium]|nr:T9SS type A sorting domain-containing protein [Crocinitomicaceae bacterium]
MKLKTITLVLFFALLILCKKNATAQITTYNVNQIVTTSSGAFTIDINNDSNDDYTFEILPLSPSSNAAGVVSLGNSQIMDISTFGYPDTLNFGDNVTGPYSSGNAVLGTDVGGGGQFTGAGIKYLGLNIEISGTNHLGWISIEVAATNDTIILHDIGYNTTENDEITAGQTNLSSIHDIALINFDIYPNPCQNLIKFGLSNLNNKVRYSIADLTGKLILNGVYSEHIDVSTLDSGTYIITISEGNKIGVKKFTKN